MLVKCLVEHSVSLIGEFFYLSDFGEHCFIILSYRFAFLDHQTSLFLFLIKVYVEICVLYKSISHPS